MGKWGRKGNNNQSKHTCTSTNGYAYGGLYKFPPSKGLIIVG